MEMREPRQTRLTAEVGSSAELNKYLNEGWVLLLSYVKYASDSQQPRFVVGCRRLAERRNARFSGIA